MELSNSARQVFHDETELASVLRRQVKGRSIIAIDGWTGVGKTTLAKALAATLCGSHYDLDSALVRDRNCYVPALRLTEVHRQLQQASGLLVLSGVCLLHVLNLVGAKACVHVYVKCMSQWGWSDEDEVAGLDIPEIKGSSGEALRAEMRSYHREWQPHIAADYEFHRQT